MGFISRLIHNGIGISELYRESSLEAICINGLAYGVAPSRLPINEVQVRKLIPPCTYLRRTKLRLTDDCQVAAACWHRSVSQQTVYAASYQPALRGYV